MSQVDSLVHPRLHPRYVCTHVSGPHSIQHDAISASPTFFAAYWWVSRPSRNPAETTFTTTACPFTGEGAPATKGTSHIATFHTLQKPPDPTQVAVCSRRSISAMLTSEKVLACRIEGGGAGGGCRLPMRHGCDCGCYSTVYLQPLVLTGRGIERH